MDSESSYIVLSVWGGPTKTRITEDQQPVPANTNLFYHKKTPKETENIFNKAFFFEDAERRRRKKRTLGEKVSRREKRLAKITDKKIGKTF